MNNLAVLYADLGKWNQAVMPDEWYTFNTRSMLGDALLGLKKYAEAEPLLVKGYEGMKEREKAIPPQAQGRLSAGADRLIELYTATDKPEEVKKWRAERAKYREVLPAPRRELGGASVVQCRSEGLSCRCTTGSGWTRAFTTPSTTSGFPKSAAP
jgi:hypothetical protein